MYNQTNFSGRLKLSKVKFKFTVIKFFYVINGNVMPESIKCHAPAFSLSLMIFINQISFYPTLQN